MSDFFALNFFLQSYLLMLTILCTSHQTVERDAPSAPAPVNCDVEMKQVCLSEWIGGNPEDQREHARGGKKIWEGKRWSLWLLHAIKEGKLSSCMDNYLDNGWLQESSSAERQKVLKQTFSISTAGLVYPETSIRGCKQISLRWVLLVQVPSNFFKPIVRKL